MKRVSKTNPLEKCSDIDKFDFEPWRENKMTKIDVGSKEEMNVNVYKNKKNWNFEDFVILEKQFFLGEIKKLK